jgi:hypothetical protein
MSTHKKTVTDYQAASEEAVQAIASVQETLPLDDGLLEHERNLAKGRRMVSPEAIEASADILSEIGQKAGTFDLDGARDALAYRDAFSSVASKLRLLADRIDASIAKRHSKAAGTATGVYRALKGQAQVDGTMVAYMERLAPFMSHSRGRTVNRSSAQAPDAAQPAVQSTPAIAPTMTAPSVTITSAGVTVGAGPAASNGH